MVIDRGSSRLKNDLNVRFALSIAPFASWTYVGIGAKFAETYLQKSKKNSSSYSLSPYITLGGPWRCKKHDLNEDICVFKSFPQGRVVSDHLMQFGAFNSDNIKRDFFVRFLVRYACTYERMRFQWICSFAFTS